MPPAMSNAAVRRFDRDERWKGRGVVAAVVLLLAWWLWMFKPWEVYGPYRHIARLCEAEYARAGSAADSSAIDQHQPMVDPEDGPARVTCGELRRAGKIPPSRSRPAA